MYLKIENAGVSSEDLFVRLGASSSRGHTDRIGQFGTGALMGSLCLLREGIDPIIFVGTHRLQYVIGETTEQCDPKGNVVRYHPVGVKISNRKPRDINIALEHGVMDWTSPDMGIREFISNAIDNDSEGGNGVKISIVENATPRPNCTVVYLPLTPAVEAYHKKISEKFLHFSDGGTDRTILPKRIAGKPNIYRKGVWVCELETLPSLFDYNLGDELRIDESRNLGTGQCEEVVSRIVCGNKVAIKALLRTLLKGDDYWECTFPTYYTRYEANAKKKLWLDTFVELFGENAIIASSKHHNLIPYAKDRGYKVVVIHDAGWYDTLSYLGFPTVLTALDNVSDKGCEEFEATPALVAHVDQVWEWLEAYNLTGGKERPTVQSFRPLTPEAEKLLGYRKGDKICVREGYESFATTLEEIAHYLSEANDLTREFQNWIFAAMTTFLTT